MYYVAYSVSVTYICLYHSIQIWVINPAYVQQTKLIIKLSAASTDIIRLNSGQTIHEAHYDLATQFKGRTLDRLTL